MSSIQEPSNKIKNPNSIAAKPISNPTISHLCFEFDSLEALARQGQWRTLIDKISRSRKLSLLSKPHEHLIYLSFNVLALAKLRRYSDAVNELETLESLDSQKYRYETYPDHYPGKCGSMVPFALRWLHAELPQRLGKKQDSLDRLYFLLDFVKFRLRELESEGNVGSRDASIGGIGVKVGKFDELVSGVSGSLEKSNLVDDREKNLYKSEASISEIVDKDQKVDPLGVRDWKLDRNEVGDVEFDERKGKLESAGSEFAAEMVSSSVEDRKPEKLSVEGGQFSEEMDKKLISEASNSIVDDSAKPRGDSKMDWGSNAYWEKICLIWKTREVFVISAIISHHLKHKEFSVSIMFLHKLLEEKPEDLVLLSKLGYVKMQLGDLEGARIVFSHIETLMTTIESGGFEISNQFKNIVNRNRALQYLVAKDYVSATREYEEAIERDPVDLVATNNKALCLMYSRDLSASIKLLESALERMPTIAVNETVVVNLCSMYELSYVNNIEMKKKLNNWITQVAPDDFDASCTRL